MLNGSLPETSSNSNATQRNSINQEIGAQSTPPPHNKGKPTVESDVENKIQASQSNNIDTINETVLSSRQITECDQNNYKSLIDAKIVKKLPRCFPLPSYVLEGIDFINCGEANKITIKLGYEKLKDFLAHATSEEFFNTNSIELLLEYKEALLKIIQCSSLKGTNILDGCYYALGQILDKLKDVSLTAKQLQFCDFDTNNNCSLNRYLNINYNDKAENFQQRVYGIQEEQTKEKDFLRQQTYNKLQGKSFLYSNNDVHPLHLLHLIL